MALLNRLLMSKTIYKEIFFFHLLQPKQHKLKILPSSSFFIFILSVMCQPVCFEYFYL